MIFKHILKRDELLVWSKAIKMLNLKKKIVPLSPHTTWLPSLIVGPSIAEKYIHPPPKHYWARHRFSTHT